MGSGTAESRDERNAGFGPSRLQEAKPGHEAAGQAEGERSDLHHRRQPTDDEKIPKASLAERIREDRDSTTAS